MTATQRCTAGTREHPQIVSFAAAGAAYVAWFLTVTAAPRRFEQWSAPVIGWAVTRRRSYARQLDESVEAVIQLDRGSAELITAYEFESQSPSSYLIGVYAAPDPPHEDEFTTARPYLALRLGLRPEEVAS